ncbi:MAG TPA: RecQ family ATP-dependent DNA helicase [Moheibacter sp.]|nr:RecQ family ATP-dependent DNA helicase [Moheibacter sp.]
MARSQEILKKYWGYPDFIHPQKEIIDAVLQGKDTLAILPTGGGKSLCYQVPAILSEGITLVISPLIALMQDQVNRLNQLGIGADSITSQLSQEEMALLFAKCQLGKIKLLYVAPERLLNRNFIQNLTELNVKIIAVDEAHCIAQWGHDFRPAYLKINKIREIFPQATLLALTATAPPKIKEEIVSALHLKNVEIFTDSLKRSNLVYKVSYSQNEMDDLVYELKKNPGSAIVFCRTRKQTFEVASFLQQKGLDADFFHAKIPGEEKKKKQEAWTQSEGQIMVATNAFGMGIDKPNVRTVLHLDLSSSLEAYVQEAGRAGRDGKESEAILFLQPYAAEEAEKIFKSGLPDRNEYQQICGMFYNYFEIGENERPVQKLEFQFTEFVRKFKLDKNKTLKILDFLERKEVILFQKKTVFSTVQMFANPKNLQFPKSVPSKILEYLLRHHPGILSEEKPISEFHIARELEKSTKKIKKALSRLSDAGYIYYRSRDLQNVVFLRPRETDFIKNTLWKEFENLQITQWKKLQDMIFYALQKEVCREKLILRYFGEKPIEKCGKCDVCKKDTTILNEVSILKFLEDSPKTVQQILIQFVNSPKESVLKILKELADEGLVVYNGIDSLIKSQKK